jgi:hypothetical protein
MRSLKSPIGDFDFDPAAEAQQMTKKLAIAEGLVEVAAVDHDRH